jgi:YbbR domain-containing protein
LKWLYGNLGTKLLALFGAFLLWGVSHSTTSIERGFDVAVVPEGMPDDLVLVGRSSDVVNIRVQGGRPALRTLSVTDLEYPVDLSGAKPGTATHQVENADFPIPRGAQVVSRSPSTIEFTLERRGSKFVKVQADLEGAPPEGYTLGKVEVIPPRVRIAGARSEVLRLGEVLTETVDVTGAEEPFERPVGLPLGGRNVWLETDAEIRVRVDIIAPPEPEPEPELEEESQVEVQG